MGRVVPLGGGAFEEAWNDITAQVSARCRQLTRDPHEAQELYQLTAIRAWRGHSAFRGDCAYLTWVMRILDREAARLSELRIRKKTHEITLNPLTADESGIDQFTSRDAGAGADGETGWLRPLLDDAVGGGAISAAEHRIIAERLAERLAEPDESWPDIAARLGMTATACAVAHSRAVPSCGSSCSPTEAS